MQKERLASGGRGSGTSRASTIVLILALDEERNIAEVLVDVAVHFPDSDVLVVDGESRDRTAEIARQHGAWVISVPNSLGHGGAMEAGLLFAREREYAYVIRVDSDGQHPTAEARRVLAVVERGEADVAIGSRFVSVESTYKASKARRFAIHALSLLLLMIVGRRFRDITSGMVAMNANAIAHLCAVNRFEYSEIEALVIFLRSGFKVREIQVAMNPRQAGQSSFSVSRAFFYVFLGVLSLLLSVFTRAR